ncbi:MAG: ribosome modulation factor [Pseudomonadota bacterium]|jgi:ribosome modulation factor
MKRCKRNPNQRIFNRGYQAGFDSRPRTLCPYDPLTEPGQRWLNGWREGREDRSAGFSLRACQAKMVSLTNQFDTA